MVGILSTESVITADEKVRQLLDYILTLVIKLFFLGNWKCHGIVTTAYNDGVLLNFLGSSEDSISDFPIQSIPPTP